MMKTGFFTQKTDYLTESIPRIYLKLGLPILISVAVSVAASLITNKIISAFCGEYYAVAAVLSSVLPLVTVFPSSVVTAGWVRYSVSFASRDGCAGKDLFNVLFAVLLCQAGVDLILFVFNRPLLAWLHTPEEILEKVRLFLFLYLLFSFLLAISTLFITLANGLESSRGVLLINLANHLIRTVALALFVGLFRFGIAGCAAYLGAASVAVAAVAICMMRRSRSLPTVRRADLRVDWRECGVIIKKGTLIFLPTVLCTAGLLLLSAQTNRLLSLDYISVLSVSVPITTGLSVFSTVVTVAIPQNYSVGDHRRTKKILWCSYLACEIYAALCALFYILFGRAYYASLFADPAVVGFGSEYWLWYGLGCLICPAQYVLRTFFVAIQRPGNALLSGAFESLGYLIGAFWLIPAFGHIGRSVAYPLGWTLNAVYVFVIYAATRNKIYGRSGSK